MAVLTRITDFIPNTLIVSQEVDDEFNQLVNLLSGVSTNKDTLLKYNNATDPALRVDQLGAGLIQQWLNNGTARASLSALGRLTLPAGIGATPSADVINNLGKYFVDPAVRATIANTTETTFSTVSTSANVFAADGDFLIYLTNFKTAANANTKRFRVYFGATVLYDSGALALNNIFVYVMGFMYRRTSTVVTGAAMSLDPGGGAATLTSLADAGGQNFATTNVFQTTGLNGTASAADIQQFGLVTIKGSL